MIRVLLLGLAFGLVMRASADWTAQDRDALGEIDDNVRFLKNQNEEDFSKLLWQLTKSRVDGTGESLSSSGNGPTIRRILLDMQRVSTNQWLKEFLLGSSSDPWWNSYPQFRFLSHGSSTATPPLNTMVFQSLTDFFTYVLGQNIDNNAIATASFDWSDFFTTNSWIRGNTSGNAATRGYKFWNIWLAEAQRRLITNQLDFAAFDQRPWTNGIPVSESSGGSEEGNRLAVSGTAAETNKLVSAIDDFQAPSGGQLWSGDLIDAPRWTLSGSQSDPVVFSGSFGSRGSFDRSALSMELKIPFSRFGGTLRIVTSFMVAVGTACCCISIIRHEVDFWTTLGGSAT